MKKYAKNAEIFEKEVINSLYCQNLKIAERNREYPTIRAQKRDAFLNH